MRSKQGLFEATPRSFKKSMRQLLNRPGFQIVGVCDVNN